MNHEFQNKSSQQTENDRRTTPATDPPAWVGPAVEQFAATFATVLHSIVGENKEKTEPRHQNRRNERERFIDSDSNSDSSDDETSHLLLEKRKRIPPKPTQTQKKVKHKRKTDGSAQIDCSSDLSESDTRLQLVPSQPHQNLRSYALTSQKLIQMYIPKFSLDWLSSTLPAEVLDEVRGSTEYLRPAFKIASKTKDALRPNDMPGKIDTIAKAAVDSLLVALSALSELLVSMKRIDVPDELLRQWTQVTCCVADAATKVQAQRYLRNKNWTDVAQALEIQTEVGEPQVLASVRHDTDFFRGEGMEDNQANFHPRSNRSYRSYRPLNKPPGSRKPQ